VIGMMARFARIAVVALILAGGWGLLSGCSGCGAWTPFSTQSPAPTAPPHRYEPIEDGVPNVTRFPAAVMTPVFGDGG